MEKSKGVLNLVEENLFKDLTDCAPSEMSDTSSPTTTWVLIVLMAVDFPIILYFYSRYLIFYLSFKIIFYLFLTFYSINFFGVCIFHIVEFNEFIVLLLLRHRKLVLIV